MFELTHFAPQTYIGHEFIVENAATGEELGTIHVEHDLFIAVGASPPSRGEEDHLEHLEEDVRKLLLGEWENKKRTSRTFTPLGFAKGKLPRDIWASMSAFYHNNRNNRIVEDFSYDILINWWTSESYLITMPPNLRRYWQGRLKELVETWSGVNLELQDIYGIRRYEEGARLLMHVDRIHTHAASIIINIRQDNVHKPWPVQIYDFADRLHQVDMEPGEILYYESARCLHGRMTPLHGEGYVNIFAHYRPVDEGETEGRSDWYMTPNPPGTPEPLLHSDKFCNFAYSANAAVCDASLAQQPFAQAHSGDDLFELWRYSSLQ